MKKTNYMPLHHFCQVHGFTKGSIQASKSAGYIPKNRFKVIDRTLYIDADYFTRRFDFYRRVKNECQEIYFKLIEKHDCTQHALARQTCSDFNRTLMSMNMFYAETLFSLPSKNLFRYKLGRLTWEFWRKYRRILKEE